VPADDAAGGTGFTSGLVKPMGGQKEIFVDFGRNKVYTLRDDSEDIVVFNNLAEVVEKFNPTTVILDNLPHKALRDAEELAKKGITFLRLKNLETLSKERQNNGLKKSDENDVKLLRVIYHRRPDAFQPLSTTPEELEVRALTELWVVLTDMKMVTKLVRTMSNNGLAVEAHKTLRRLANKLSDKIHRMMLSLPLYRKAFEELGLKGPTLAYIIAHDAANLKNLPRDRLVVRYQLLRRPWRRRPRRRQILIKLAKSTIINRHPRYYVVYTHYREKGKGHWQAILRVAKIILKDLRRLARETRKEEAATPA